MTKKAEKKRVLVVGDWCVDEHWILGEHRLPSAVRTGKRHYRALHQLNSTVRVISGAGLTCSMLQQAKDQRGERLFDVFSAGIWHERDTGYLRQLLEPHQGKGDTHFNLVHYTEPSPGPGANTEDGTLFNLAGIVEPLQIESLKSSAPTSTPYEYRFGTTRIIRLYANSGEDTEQISRVDWEVAPPGKEPGKLAWFPPGPLETSGQIDRECLGRFRDFLKSANPHVLVVEDLGKGVVCDAFVKWLVDNLAQPTPPECFVVMRSWKPTWLSHLERLSIRLLFLHKTAARDAQKKETIGNWYQLVRSTTSRARLSNKALEVIAALSARPQDSPSPSPAHVVIQANEWSLIGYDGATNAGIIQLLSDPVQSRIETAQASILFPTIIANLLGSTVPPTHGAAAESALIASVKRSFRYAIERVRKDLDERFHPVRVWDPAQHIPELRIPNAGLHADSTDDPTKDDPGNWVSVPQWNEEVAEWQQASKECGIIRKTARPPEPSPGPRIELWRAMTTLNDYVCMVESKRSSILRIIGKLKEFVSDRNRGLPRRKSVMVVADPGSGKTQLATALARSAGLYSIDFDISQMISRTDLLDCFDTIRATADEHSNRGLLVFVDEVNARVSSEEVYQAFLGPLENGTFIRQGRRFSMPDCFWFFVGTSTPTEGKAPDFVSRLDLQPQELINQRAEEKTIHLENVYLGAYLIRKSFPEVRYVSSAVLSLFGRLPITTTAREIVHLVRSFRDVQYAQVWASNVPDESLSLVCHTVTDKPRTPAGEQELGGFDEYKKNWRNGAVCSEEPIELHD
ncbi:MAG: ATP-binding protein [Phycisphaerales bacterium]|nr:ATP-binding protein [Phycisphaerales bacterium]